jgi:hypothetical protein
MAPQRGVKGTIDLAHAALANFREHFIRSQTGTDENGHDARGCYFATRRGARDVPASCLRMRPETLKSFAAARGHSLLELACSWLASRSQVASVIAGQSRTQRMRGGPAEAGHYFFNSSVQSDTTATGTDDATAVLIRKRSPSAVTPY